MKAIMTRERILKAIEVKVDPNDPNKKLEQVYENEDSSGWWNEYYRVFVVPDDWSGDYDELVESLDWYDFYSYSEAKKVYDKIIKGEIE